MSQGLAKLAQNVNTWKTYCNSRAASEPPGPKRARWQARANNGEAHSFAAMQLPSERETLLEKFNEWKVAEGLVPGKMPVLENLPEEEEEEAQEVYVPPVKSLAKKFHEAVVSLREYLVTQGDLPVFASPRFAYASAMWLCEGIEVKEVLEMELYRGVNEDILSRIRAKCEALFASFRQVKKPHDPHITDKIETQGKHKRTALIKTVMRKGKFPFLWGSPGAGKTHACESYAQDMGLPFMPISCAQDMFKSEIQGSVSQVSFQYMATSFRDAWENGGVILFDEAGLASGSFLNILNAGMAQGQILFPDKKLVKRHEHCFILFADNSALYGNDPKFPERGDVGGAFRDRLTYISFGYDEKIELSVLESIFS